MPKCFGSARRFREGSCRGWEVWLGRGKGMPGSWLMQSEDNLVRPAIVILAPTFPASWRLFSRHLERVIGGRGRGARIWCEI